MQQVVASLLLWVRTLWVYRREADHLRDVADGIVEHGSICDSSDGAAPASGVRFELPHQLAGTHYAVRW